MHESILSKIFLLILNNFIRNEAFLNVALDIIIRSRITFSRLLHNINYLFRKNYSSYYFWEDINEYMVVIMLTNLVNFDTVTEGAETEVDKNTSLP